MPAPAGRRAGPTRCCSPSRSRSAPGAFAPCSCAACRRASSRGRPRPSRSSPTSAASSWRRAAGCGCAPREDALAAERYLFYAALSRATERVVPGLPQLRRGGQPRPALAVHRRRGRAARRRLARPGAAGGCSPTSSGTPERGPHRARARPRRGATAAPRPAASRRAPARARRRGAGRDAPHRDPVGRGARGLRRLPGALADRARAPARAARARARGARARQPHARRARARCSASSTGR